MARTCNSTPKHWVLAQDQRCFYHRLNLDAQPISEEMLIPPPYGSYKQGESATRSWSRQRRELYLENPMPTHESSSKARPVHNLPTGAKTLYSLQLASYPELASDPSIQIDNIVIRCGSRQKRFNPEAWYDKLRISRRLQHHHQRRYAGEWTPVLARRIHNQMGLGASTTQR